MSGTALNEWGIVPRNNWAYRLAVKAGYTGSVKDAEVLKYLQSIEALEIVKSQENIMTIEERKLSIHFPFAPVIEPYQTENSFITEHPILMTRKAWGNEIPIMLGGTSEEGLIQMPDIKEHPETLENLEMKDFIPLEIKVKNVDDELIDKFANRIKQCYYKNSDPKTDSRSYFEVSH